MTGDWWTGLEAAHLFCPGCLLVQGSRRPARFPYRRHF